VKDVSFRLPKGKTLGLVGESGSGKTTVGLTLMRLHEATGGKVLFEGTDLLALTERQMMAYRKRIQIIFQNPYASLNPRFTVGQILVEPRGEQRFGWDAWFQPAGSSKTFAEMAPEEKDNVSHRGKAYRQLAALLKEESVPPAGRR